MLLEATGLTVYYGVVKALVDASFNVAQGEIVAMIGPNGAGKSTALKAVSGLLHHFDGSVRSGEIRFGGVSILGLRTDQLVTRGIGIVPEGRRVFATMTVRENLEMGAYTRKDRREIQEDYDTVLDLFPRLRERLKQKAGTLSTGEQQMLAIGRALMLRPRLLLADEPSLGLSPNFVDAIFDKLIEINKLGMSILLVEQNARMALEIAHRAYVFEIGRIAMEGPANELSRDARIKEVYLGGVTGMSGP